MRGGRGLILALVAVAVAAAGCSSSKAPAANGTPAPASSVGATAVTGSAPGSAANTPPPATGTATVPGSSGGVPSATGAGATATAATTTTTTAEWLSFDADIDKAGITAAGPDPANAAVKWRSPQLDGDIYGQPLLHANTLFVATENDSVAALSTADGRVLWTKNLGQPVPQSALPCGNIDPTGITGTPVLSADGTTIYVVTFLQPGHHQLVALDTSNGDVRWTHEIDPPGLSPLVEQQRSALTLANGRVYVAYGGLFGDCGPYKGAVVSLAADGTGDTASWIVPTERLGGIWAPGGGSVDASGNLYYATGNAASSDNANFDYGNAVVRLTPDLQLADYWAPKDWVALSDADKDLGSQGPVLIGNNRVFVAGKGGTGYILDATNLGHIDGEVSHLQVCDQAFGASATDGSTIVVACQSVTAGITVAADGSLRAKWKVDGGRGGSPVIAGTTVWITLNNGHTRALDLASGKVVGDVAVADSLVGFPSTTVTSTAVYVTGANVVTMIG